MKPKITFYIVLTIVLLGEWASDIYARNPAMYSAIAILVFAMIFIGSVLRREKQ